MIKKIIKEGIKFFGYDLKKIETKKASERKEVNTKGYTVSSPLEHNTAKNMDDYFSDEGNLNGYVKRRQAFYNLLMEKIMEQSIDFSGSLKICDVGCGPGDLLSIICDKLDNPDANFFGFDHSEKLVQIGKRRFTNINFQKFNLFEESEQYRNSFDLVICSEVLEHLIEARLAIDKLMSMVKKSGLLVITVPEGRVDNYLGHINFWSPESWNQFINEVVLEKGNLEFTTTVIDSGKHQYNFASIKII